ncbi:DUF2285 domain-containing protein [Paracoccus methylovorus]|uniref:DUF2285 domain-containing protein n=1 Tax=Paracoccus methylovorus TaxID=2812658 RepID=UPI0038996182
MILTAAPEGYDRPPLLDPADLPLAPVLRTSDGLHGIVTDAGGDHRLWFPQGRTRIRLAIVVPLDEDLMIRLNSIRRFHRLLTGGPVRPIPSLQALSSSERHRAILMLRAWDGAASGASRRDIAGVLFRSDFSGLSAAEWKSASERRQLARILAEARAMVGGEYLTLLREHSHRRR